MRIALVHDWLNHKRGGAEAVLLQLADLYPQADIYTLVYQPQYFPELATRAVYGSLLQRYPSKLRQNPKYLLPRIRRAVEHWSFEDYDLVISSSGAWAKNITPPASGQHLCYCYTPARMLWDQWPYYLDQLFPPGRKSTQPARLALLKLCSSLRVWDYYGAQSVTEFAAISHYIAGRVSKFYRRDSKVIYPPVDTQAMKPSGTVAKQDYYVIVSVLSKYKQIDIAITAFKQSGRLLVIAGDGPDQERLQHLAKGAGNISFRGRISESNKAQLLQQAKGFVFTSIEDFGIAPVEAMAAGTPVVALRGGGLAETVIKHKTGVFFDQPTPQSLNEALSAFEKLSFRPTELYKQAAKYDKDVFRHQIQDWVASYGK